AEWTEWLDRAEFLTHVGIYAYRADILRFVTSLPQSPLEKAESLEQLRWLENGLKIKVALTDTPTVGIDTPEDLEAAEALLK
ncbi:MAG: 3-deoxy-manno-octulosonate cytidylyltransferase, partial [Muribaculaceae bacterium]|nr:3-deoxy-manno-octulosonate cytidylyltransferase [Muribaculaceae bacterium]